MSLRLILAAIATLLATTIAAAGLGVVNVVPTQLVWALSGSAFGFGLYRLPGLLRMLFARIDGRADAGVLALSAGGTAAVAALIGIGAHALLSSRFSDAWLETVWTVWFPGLPLAGILAGLGRFAYLEAMRWAAADREE